MKELLLELKRIAKQKTYTIGKLYVDGVYLCDTLEDRCIDWTKQKKVKGQTAIPEGRYQVKLTLSPRFKRLLPELIDVPNYENIRIHSGNTEVDTMGCPLLGENKVKGMVINSRPYEKKLVEILNKHKGEIFIEIS